MKLGYSIFKLSRYHLSPIVESSLNLSLNMVSFNSRVSVFIITDWIY